MFSTILAKIQVLMLQNDIERMQADPNFSLDSSDGEMCIRDSSKTAEVCLPKCRRVWKYCRLSR